MKVNSASTSSQASSRPSKEAIQAKLREKFGKDFGKKPEKSEKKEDSAAVVSIDKNGKKKVSKEGFGDVKNNDPTSEVTQEKLKGLLRSGGFNFNSKERAALDAILNK